MSGATGSFCGSQDSGRSPGSFLTPGCPRQAHPRAPRRLTALLSSECASSSTAVPDLRPSNCPFSFLDFLSLRAPNLPLLKNCRASVTSSSTSSSLPGSAHFFQSPSAHPCSTEPGPNVPDLPTFQVSLPPSSPAPASLAPVPWPPELHRYTPVPSPFSCAGVLTQWQPQPRWDSLSHQLHTGPTPISVGPPTLNMNSEKDCK